MIGYIYLLHNKINNKIYIGQTYTSIKKRWSKHKSDAKTKNYPICRAIRKHKNFAVYTVTQIHEDDKSLLVKRLNILETTWIVKLNSTNTKIGYNTNTGGNNTIYNPESRLAKSKRMQPLNDHPNQMKLCSICKILKPYSEFVKSNCNSFGVNYHCKSCRSIKRALPPERFKYTGNLLNTDTHKYCANCKLIKPRTEFYKSKTRVSSQHCISCSKQIALIKYHRRQDSLKTP